MRLGEVKTGTGPDDFYRMVLAETDCTIVEAVYRVLDRLNAQMPQKCGIELACQSGCSICCEQVVCVTLQEWELIERFLVSSDLLTKFARQFEQTIVEFGRYGPKVCHDALALTRVSEGKPCIFAHKGKCVIYPVRPVVCRITTSTRRCRSMAETAGQQMRFDYEQYANNLVLETAQAAQGHMGVTPLPYLLGMLVVKVGTGGVGG